MLDRFRQHRDTARQVLRLARNVPRLTPISGMSPARQLEHWADECPRSAALLFEEQRYSWAEMNARANQYAHWFNAHGVGRDDVVALVMTNRPDFLFVLFGLSKLGAVASLINTNLTGAALAHAVRVCEPKAVLAGAELAEPVRAALEADRKLATLPVWVQSEDPNAAEGIQAQVRNCSEVAPRSDFRASNDSVFCYIYTSGTTGLPKAAIIKNQRMLGANYLFGHLMHRSRQDSVVYVPLPLYHSNALFLGFGSALGTGSATALRRKFSASNFWSDVRRYEATSFVYIGELCRYLLNTPSDPEERDHRLEVGVGNGLRPDIWEAFQRRFGVPVMREFYGSTEGNAPTLNMEGKPGMIGKLGRGQILVRCDASSGELVRGASGFCEQIAPGEVGLLLGRINPLIGFEGYVDKKATEKKIVRDVLKRGDAYFNTGDLIQLHADKWLSFADRLGDTFRWKGENVSTNEVAELLNRVPGVLESNVYGVHVPGAEGRAGMGALTVTDEFDLGAFTDFVGSELPVYQRPLFLRLLREGAMRITGTFKHQKGDYKKEGFDPQQVNEPLYYLREGKYVPLDHETFDNIQRGELMPG